MGQNKNLKIGFIIFLSMIFSINVFGASHLPPALLNLENQTNEYLSMTSILSIVIYSLFAIFSPFYILLFLLYLSFTLLYFKKKSHQIIFISSFVILNTLTYYFNAGLISLFMAQYDNIVVNIGILFFLLSIILIYLIEFNKIKKKVLDFHIKLLAFFSGTSTGLFFIQYPEKIRIALEFALSYNPYFARFLFGFKILFFIILSLIPMIILVELIKRKKYPWAKKINNFLIEFREKILYSMFVILFIIFILIIKYRNFLV